MHLNSNKFCFMKVKLISFLLIFSVFTLFGFFYLLLFSSIGGQQIVNLIVSKFLHNIQQIKYEEIRGSLVGGLYFKNLRLVVTPNNKICNDVKSNKTFIIKFKDLFLKTNLLKIFQNELNIEYFSATKVEVFGDLHLPQNFYHLPAPIELNAYIPLKIVIQSVKIDKLYITLDKSNCIQLYIENLNLSERKSENDLLLLDRDNNSNLSSIKTKLPNIALLKLYYKDKIFLIANVLGFYNPKTFEIDSIVESNLLGNQIVIEMFISLFNKKSSTPISANILECQIDLAKVFRWLSSLWIDKIPIAFDGIVQMVGSFLYNSNVGFVSNIEGKINNLRLLTTLFFWNFATINANFRIFNKKLDLVLVNSKLGDKEIFGSGTIELFEKNQIIWNCKLNALNISLKEFINTMPWLMRKSLNLSYEIIGFCNVFASIQGRCPLIEVTFEIYDGEFISKNHKYNFNLKYLYSNNFSEPCKLKFSWNLYPANEEILNLFKIFYKEISSDKNILYEKVSCNGTADIVKENETYSLQASGKVNMAIYNILFTSRDKNKVEFRSSNDSTIISNLNYNIANITNNFFPTTSYKHNSSNFEKYNLEYVIFPIKFLEKDY